MDRGGSKLVWLISQEKEWIKVEKNRYSFSACEECVYVDVYELRSHIQLRVISCVSGACVHRFLWGGGEGRRSDDDKKKEMSVGGGWHRKWEERERFNSQNYDGILRRSYPHWCHHFLPFLHLVHLEAADPRNLTLGNRQTNTPTRTTAFSFSPRSLG